MAIELPELPWSKDALAPHISAETIDYHYGKHHAGYVKKLNAAIEGSDLAEKSLVDIIRAGGGTFNNAAQIWNHTFYWNSLSPSGGGEPSGAIADAINGSFGSYANFREEFAKAAATQFGSGWAWLVAEGDKLAVQKSKDAETPITTSAKPLLTIDVWEHAYYIDYRNERPRYIETYLEQLINWDFANQNLNG